MDKFVYVNAESVDQVPSLLGDNWDTKVIAGGTDLIGEMKDYIESPKKIVNLKTIPDLDQIEVLENGLRIGTMTTLAEIAEHAEIRKNYEVLSVAANFVATPQIRNVGTIGGNLCQRPRCWYYRDADTICLKKGGDKCFALLGKNKYNAIFGGGPVYIVHPSDTAPALVSLGSSVTIRGSEGDREVKLEDFFVLPTPRNPNRENVLKPNEIITHIHVPKPSANTKSFYFKIREKEAHDFAIASLAGVFEMDGKICQRSSIILGAVAPKPWRSTEAENILNGKTVTEKIAEIAGEKAIEFAEPLSDNEYKVFLVRNLIKRAVLYAIG